MGFYLLDNPPASQQFWPSRNNPLTGGVVLHTTEGVGGDDSAENTAGFISRRTDGPGSYHCIVDWNSTVMLLPDEYTAFGVAASGYNSRCWMIALACRKDELAVEDFYTNVMIDRAGKAIVEFWQRNGFDPVASNDWIGDGTLERAGLTQHGTAQPVDRSDAWVGHPQEFGLGILLQDAILRYAGAHPVTPPPEVVPAPLPDMGPMFDSINAAKAEVLKVGSTGDAVRWCQSFLNALKGYGLAVDGVFGLATFDAVRRFQADTKDFFNLPAEFTVDGICGPQTWFWLTV